MIQEKYKRKICKDCQVSKNVIEFSLANQGKSINSYCKNCASFDLSNLGQQKLCFYYSNLQPLWAQENLRKKDRII